MNAWIVNAAIWLPIALNLYMHTRIENKLSPEDSIRWRKEAGQWRWAPFRTSSKYQELFPHSSLPLIDRCVFVLGLSVLAVELFWSISK